ncbi:1487_t:CDS:2 [Funneliformis caledonium]|uniref:1487_t:CDS:1 n=1 Tax=Funneliformis caledonium TaxID=1117310 RepID=A0A9N8Z0Z7_9GLOM|nr:1487_t:CDS:2 [Funneliformis caledonium]
MAMPFLWYNPFELPNQKGNILLQTLISCLSENDKERLQIRNVKFHFLSQSPPPLFDYPRYIRTFNSEKFTSLYKRYHSKDKNNDIFLFQLLINMIFDTSYGFKHFVNNYTLSDYNHALQKIISCNKNLPKVFSNIQKLEFQCAISLLHNTLTGSVSSLLRNVRHLLLIIRNDHDHLQNNFDIIPHFIQSMIELKSLVINEHCINFNKEAIFKAIKSHENSLTFLGFQIVNDYSLLIQILISCTKLETLEITQERTSFFTNRNPSQQFYLNNHQISVKHFYHKNIIGNENFFKTFLRMTSRNLQTFSSRYITRDIVEIMREHCPNISYLNISTFSFYISSFFQLIDSLKLLEHFTLEIQDGYPNFHEYDLQQLASKLPHSLNYLGINFFLTPNQLNFFLKECKAQIQTLELNYFHLHDFDYVHTVIKYSQEVKCLKLVKYKKGIYGMGYCRFNPELHCRRNSSNEKHHIYMNKGFKTFKKKYDLIDKGAIKIGDLSLCEVKPYSYSFYDRIFNSAL